MSQPSNKNELLAQLHRDRMRRTGRSNSEQNSIRKSNRLSPQPATGLDRNKLLAAIEKRQTTSNNNNNENSAQKNNDDEMLNKTSSSLLFNDAVDLTALSDDDSDVITIVNETTTAEADDSASRTASNSTNVTTTTTATSSRTAFNHYRNSNNTNNKSTATTTTTTIRDQLKQRQEKLRRKNRMLSPNIKTMRDLHIEHQQERNYRIEGNSYSSSSRSSVHTIENTLYDADRLGREALKLTNEFRAQHYLPPLKWSQPIAEVGKVHSKNMGEGRAPFNHDGFSERVQKYPEPSSGAAENLSWSTETVDAAKVAVNGWINSPGHRANLLAIHSHCGIGVYRTASGKIYMTQLFALYN